MTLKEQHKLTFGTERPIIGCLHMLPLPGTPYWDPGITLKEQVRRLTHDAKIMKDLGFDAFVFANEGDRPYLSQVGPEVIASYVRILKSFLSWCNEESITQLNIKLQKGEETIKETYSDAELTLTGS